MDISKDTLPDKYVCCFCTHPPGKEREREGGREGGREGWAKRVREGENEKEMLEEWKREREGERKRERKKEGRKRKERGIYSTLSVNMVFSQIHMLPSISRFKITSEISGNDT